jgi:hypothetical protein
VHVSLGSVTETYELPFEVIAYRGPLTYQAHGSVLSASARLRQLEAPTNRLSGNLQLRRLDAATLAGEPGVLADGEGRELPFLVADDYHLEQGRYVAVFVIDDFHPATTAPDYRFWVASVADTADDDHDGIPNLGDEDFLGVTGEVQPTIVLRHEARGLVARLTGTPGHLSRLERSPTLEPMAWSAAQEVVLGRWPIELDLGSASGSAAFWRLVGE